MPDPKLVQLLVAVGVACGGMLGGMVLAVRRARYANGHANGSGFMTPAMCRELVSKVHALEIQQAVNMERITALGADLRTLSERLLAMERKA